MPESILNSAEDSTSSAEAEVSQMTGSSSLLDNLVIASPCPVLWDTMNLTEDERKRLCKQCDKHVYDLSGMSRNEAEELLKVGAGKICVNFFQRPDGTVMTDDCPAALKALRNRYRKIATALIGLLASVLNLTPVHAQKATRLGGKVIKHPPASTQWGTPPSYRNEFDKKYELDSYESENLKRLCSFVKAWQRTTPQKGVFRVTVDSSGKVEDCVVLLSTGNVKDDNRIVKAIEMARLSSFSKAERRRFLTLDYSKQQFRVPQWGKTQLTMPPLTGGAKTLGAPKNRGKSN